MKRRSAACDCHTRSSTATRRIRARPSLHSDRGVTVCGNGFSHLTETADPSDWKESTDAPCLALVLLAGYARADIPAPCTGGDHTPERAGYPPCVASYARPAASCKYAVGYIGGGCLGCTGERRCPDEGTFGWDYTGGWKPCHVFLNWCHCAKQPPAGPYKTDGPHVPDVLSVHPIRQTLSEPKCEGEH